MPRITKITPREELKNILVEALLNHTDQVTKVSNNSVLSGIGYGIATTAQKALVEVAAVESYLNPDVASGTQLDTIAYDRGIGTRFSASGSSTYLRVVADSGTSYVSGTHTFTGNDGIVFDLDSNFTVGTEGYAYAKVSSSTTGLDTNVAALTINTVSPIPTGHLNVINEYAAVGGRDDESDDIFRKRIKEGVNILARGTISALEQAFMKINNNVLRVINQGLTSLGNIKLAIVTQNGVDLTSGELSDLLDAAGEFVSLTELKPYGGTTYGVELVNIEYFPIDVNFRVVLTAGYDTDTYRIDVQTKMSKYLDFRNFDSATDQVEWDDLLEIAKNTKGAKSVPDQYFFVNTGRADVNVDRSKLPRMRSFSIFDSDGVLIQDISGNLDPVYYPNQIDLNYQLTALKSI